MGDVGSYSQFMMLKGARLPKAIIPLHDYLSSTVGFEYLSFSRMYSPLPLGRIQYTRVMNSNKQKSPKKNGSTQAKAPKPAPAQPLVESRQSRRARAQIANKGKQRTAYAPSAVATGTLSMQPMIQSSRNSCRIVHRELVASVLGASAFTVGQSFNLNPGLATTFPWLSSQAQSWEEYRFNKLKFCYYTRTGSNTPGSVQLVPDYDAADAPPASEQIASSFEDVVEDAPWKDLECQLNPRSMFPMGPRKFIRSGALAGNLDIKTYDAGQLFVCSIDGTAVNWGKLWVEYDVELSVPANAAAGSAPATSQHVTSASPTSLSILPIPVTRSGSSAIVTIAGNVLTFQQAGRYLVSLLTSATQILQNAAPAVAAGGALIATYGTAGTATAPAPGLVPLQQQTVLMDAIIGSTLTFDSAIVGGNTAELFIARVPSLQT